MLNIKYNKFLFNIYKYIFIILYIIYIYYIYMKQT